jgi:hypothetical protein
MHKTNTQLVVHYPVEMQEAGYYCRVIRAIL